MSDLDAARLLRAQIEQAEALTEMARTCTEGFRSLALQADKYDAQIAELTDTCADLGRRVDTVTRLLFDEGGHSVKAVE